MAAPSSTPGPPFRAPRRAARRRAAGAVPRAQARRQAFLGAAFDLFLERGYGGVTMGDIVGRAGGSLTTLYELFGSKERLFEAILVDFASDLTGPLEDEALDEKSIEQALTRLGERFLKKILQPRSLAWYRMATAEAAKFPELRASFLRGGKGTLRGRLADYFTAQSRAGRLRVADPELAAIQFLELIKAPLHTRAVFGDLDAVPRGAVARQARAAVRTFLYGYCS
jgi:AcrR family transcriptional regulator